AEPGLVRQVADDRLDQQAGERRRDPQGREIVEARSQRLEDPAHVRILEREADLYAEKTEGDIPQPGKRLPRLLRHRRVVHWCGPPCARGWQKLEPRAISSGE